MHQRGAYPLLPRVHTDYYGSLFLLGRNTLIRFPIFTCRDADVCNALLLLPLKHDDFTANLRPFVLTTAHPLGGLHTFFG